MSLKHENGPKAEPVQVPERKLKYPGVSFYLRKIFRLICCKLSSKSLFDCPKLGRVGHMHRNGNASGKFLKVYRVSREKSPAFERLLLPEYISNDILQYLIE